MIAALILIPAVAGLAAFLIRRDRLRRLLFVVAAALHAALTAGAWVLQPAPVWDGWLAADAVGLLFLSLVSALFLAVAVYALGYLEMEECGEREIRFTGCLLLFLSTMTTACLSHHFGLFWVATEATTLASAPLIFFQRHHRSLEATWKYILLCSVGIALALLGNSFLAMACPLMPLQLESLLAHAAQLNGAWLRAAFLLFLVGYGTKMGLAPLHAWLPDAHSEAPSLVSALLSGALLNCAFLGILRIHQVLAAARQAAFSQELMMIFGLISMGTAAVFIQGQGDYKRMLAYSSVEHMGILALGVGLGGVGAFGAMLHAVNHSILKAMLFMAAGNILSAYKTKSVAQVQGVLRMLPVSGIIWMLGFLAITGSPPFGIFLSELMILKAAVAQGRILVVSLYLVFLALIFVGMATIVLRMACGQTSTEARRREHWILVAPPVAFAACALALGLYLPLPLKAALQQAAEVLRG